MAELTQDIDRQIKSIACKLSANYDDRQDCIQEARIRILEMKDGFTMSYYVTAAKWRMRDYLKKTRLNRGETDERIIEPIDEIFETTFNADNFKESRSFSGNDTIINRGKKKVTFRLDGEDEDDFKKWSANDLSTQKWLNGHDFGGGQ